MSRNYFLKSFTLIEILIVLGIIGIISTTFLVILNPSEAQKKSRDLKRLKDLNELSAVMEQFIVDRRTPTGCLSTQEGCLSCGATSNSCSNNWLQEDLCNYIETVPADPLNCKEGSFVSGTSIDQPEYISMTGQYAARISGSSFYKLEAFQEARANLANNLNDNGISQYTTEFGNELNIDIGL